MKSIWKNCKNNFLSAYTIILNILQCNIKTIYYITLRCNKYSAEYQGVFIMFKKQILAMENAIKTLKSYGIFSPELGKHFIVYRDVGGWIWEQL